jgi:hypothetical protein
MDKLTAGIGAAALALVACGAGDAGALPTEVGPDDVILIVSDEGGFAPVEMLLGRHPRFVLQADGRLYTPGFVTAIYPGPLLTPIFVGTVSDETLAEILRLVRAAGLPEIERVEDTAATSHVADAPTTVITYFDGTSEHTLSVYALGIASEESDTARAAASVVRALDRAAAELTDATEYLPSRIEIRSGDRTTLPDAEFRNPRPWPLALAPDELPEAAHGWRCVVVEGRAATELLDVFGAANQATTWEHVGTEHTLLARGLMPGEPGCA